jgi:hypothetical protein
VWGFKFDFSETYIVYVEDVFVVWGWVEVYKE